MMRLKLNRLGAWITAHADAGDPDDRAALDVWADVREFVVRAEAWAAWVGRAQAGSARAARAADVGAMLTTWGRQAAEAAEAREAATAAWMATVKAAAWLPAANAVEDKPVDEPEEVDRA